MKTPKMTKVSGAPSFCWHCTRQLQRAPERGLGLFFAHIVQDRAGVDHRVHGDCLPIAVDDGCKHIAQVADDLKGAHHV